MQELVQRQIVNTVLVTSVTVPSVPTLLDTITFSRMQLAINEWDSFIMNTGGNSPNRSQNFCNAIQQLNQDKKIAERFKSKKDEEVYFAWKRNGNDITIEYFI